MLEFSNTAYIGLGSNIGDKLDYLQQAIKLFQNQEDIDVSQISSVYLSAAQDYESQDDFYNMVIEISTDLSAFELLEFCQSIENEIGRVKTIRFGPRTIDADILLYNQQSIDYGENLIIPHPRLMQRKFVLLPLAELKGGCFKISFENQDVLLASLLNKVDDQRCKKLDFLDL